MCGAGGVSVSLELTRTKERAKRRVRTVAGPAFCIAARMHFRPQLQVPAKAGKKHKSGEPISFSEETHFAIYKNRKIFFFKKNYSNFYNQYRRRRLDAGVTGCKNCCNFLGKNKNCKKNDRLLPQVLKMRVSAPDVKNLGVARSRGRYLLSGHIRRLDLAQPVS